MGVTGFVFELVIVKQKLRVLLARYIILSLWLSRLCRENDNKMLIYDCAGFLYHDCEWL